MNSLVFYRTHNKHSQSQQQEATCRPLRPGNTLTFVLFYSFTSANDIGAASYNEWVNPSGSSQGFPHDCILQVGAGGGGGPPAPASVALTYSSASVIVTSDRHHGPQAARYIFSYLIYRKLCWFFSVLYFLKQCDMMLSAWGFNGESFPVTPSVFCISCAEKDPFSDFSLFLSY